MDTQDQTRFEAMTTGTLLDRAFRLYGQNFILMMGIVAAAYVPVYLFMLVLQLFFGASAVPPHRQLLWILIHRLVDYLLWAAIALPLATGAVTYAISERYLGNTVTTGQALVHSLKRLWHMSIAQLTVGVRVIVGLLLFVVPGILWWLSYILVIPVVLVEGLKPAPSLRRSWELVKGHRRKVAAVMLVVYLLQGVLTLGVGGFGRGLLEASGMGIAIGTALVSLISIFFTPLAIIAVVLLYYDLRIRKEGFDLEMLNRSMVATAPSAPVTPAPHPSL